VYYFSAAGERRQEASGGLHNVTGCTSLFRNTILFLYKTQEAFKEAKERVRQAASIKIPYVKSYLTGGRPCSSASRRAGLGGCRGP
jgi:hypothetical protein